MVTLWKILPTGFFLLTPEQDIDETDKVLIIIPCNIIISPCLWTVGLGQSRCTQKDPIQAQREYANPMQKVQSLGVSTEPQCFFSFPLGENGKKSLLSHYFNLSCCVTIAGTLRLSSHYLLTHNSAKKNFHYGTDSLFASYLHSFAFDCVDLASYPSAACL